MARTNRPAPAIHTHEGAKAKRIDAAAQLRRSVMSCFLWENEFYEDGVLISDRINALVPQVHPQEVLTIAKDARSIGKIRHAPLMLAASLCKHHGGGLAAKAVELVVERADELAEIVSLMCRINGVGPDKAKKVMGNAMKRGLAAAFQKFDAYQLAKYDREGAIRLRDVLFMCHAKPKNALQADNWRQLIDGKLAAPDTWEVGLSGGGDKRETFDRLLRENKLGYLALLRNLRNMVNAGVDLDLISEKILARKGADRVLPFRFIAAALAVPQLERVLDQALLASISEMPRLDGKTIILVDVSGSMNGRLSDKSDLTRMDAAAALASIWPGEARVLSFSYHTVEVPHRRGMAGVDAIRNSQHHGGTDIRGAVQIANLHPHDRLIVITDEQSHTTVPAPVAKKAYMINVASAKNGVGYHEWTHIDGFSESVLRFIHMMESE